MSASSRFPMEEVPSSTAAATLPVPEETGTQAGSQKPGSPDLKVLPITSETGGLYQPNVADLMLAAQNQQIREMAKIAGESVDLWVGRQDKKISELERLLRDEKVAHARTEERLNNALQKSGTNAVLNSLGGALFGYGLGASTNALVFMVIGAILLILGSLPWASLLLGRK
jgi:tetrahydromethanopterin S-methyltransferase subunit B